MKTQRNGDGERSLAVFIDFENLGLGFQNRRDKFDIHKVLERLVEKGKIVAKKAYADWSRFSSYTTALHEAAIELVEIPRRGVSGKNSADIRLVVDAIDLAYSKEHIDTFVIVSGDSDFSPLVSKLKELGKHVIGMGLADATSDLLRDNCDEFIYYEDLDRPPLIPPHIEQRIPERKRKAFVLLMESLHALRRENKEIIYSSLLKDTMKRKKPSFNEEYYGYHTFSEFLEDAARLGLLELEKHKASGTYIVTRFGVELEHQPRAERPRTLPPTATPPATVAPPATAAIPTASGGRRNGDRDSRRSSETVHDTASGPAVTPSTPKPPADSPPSVTKLTPAVDTQAITDKQAIVEPLLPIDRPLGRALVEEVGEWIETDEAEATPPSYPPRPATPLPPRAMRAATGSPRPPSPTAPSGGASAPTSAGSSAPTSKAASAPPSTAAAPPPPRGTSRRGNGNPARRSKGGGPRTAPAAGPTPAVAEPASPASSGTRITPTDRVLAPSGAYVSKPHTPVKPAAAATSPGGPPPGSAPLDEEDKEFQAGIID